MRYIPEPEDEQTIDATETMYPSLLTNHRSTRTKRRGIGVRNGTAYGYVVAGTWMLEHDAVDAKLKPGSFFAVPDLAEIQGEGQLVTIVRYGYRCLPIVGRRESRGRLSYIDGCSDSMLVVPGRLGDPCFNHLHFPGGILQTQHTHPSIRLGIIAAGSGEAWYEGSTVKAPWQIPLLIGGVFCLDEQEQHSFKTFGQPMDVIAFHPDSDWGPTDANHPMLNRTYMGNAFAFAK